MATITDPQYRKALNEIDRLRSEYVPAKMLWDANHEVDRLRAELDEVKRDADNGWMLARSWEEKSDNKDRRIAELEQELFEERQRKQDAETCHQAISDQMTELEAQLADANGLIQRINASTGSKSFEAALEFHGLLADVRRAAIDNAREE